MSEVATSESPFPLGFSSAHLRPTQYLRFEQLPNPGRKTSRWDVLSQSSGVLLGRIAWYGAWRQYCFYAQPETIFNTDCLVAIADRVETCNRYQRNIRENLKALEAKSTLVEAGA